VLFRDFESRALPTSNANYDWSRSARIRPWSCVALLGNAHHKQRVREVSRPTASKPCITPPLQACTHRRAEHRQAIIIIFSALGTPQKLVECASKRCADIHDRRQSTNGWRDQRFSEIVLKGCMRAVAATRLCMVRFGTYWKSSRIRRTAVSRADSQWRTGTVTHKDVIRYFMNDPGSFALVSRPGPWRGAATCSCWTWASPCGSRILRAG